MGRRMSAVRMAFITFEGRLREVVIATTKGGVEYAKLDNGLALLPYAYEEEEVEFLDDEDTDDVNQLMLFAGKTDPERFARMVGPK